MTTTPETAREAIPQDGSLVEARGQRWVVSDSAPGGDGSTLLNHDRYAAEVKAGLHGKRGSRKPRKDDLVETPLF